MNVFISGKSMFFYWFTLMVMTNCGNPPASYTDVLRQYTEKESAPFIPLDVVIGTRFPVLECTTIHGEKVDEKYFKDKICIINCWFITCAPCVAEIPGFNEIVNRYGKDNLRYLSISMDDKEDVLAFLADHEWHFDHVSDGKQIIKETLKLPWGFPTTFVVDQKGIIRKVVNGGKTDSTASAFIQHKLTPTIDSLRLIFLTLQHAK
jgi:peroxiredoxin